MSQNLTSQYLTFRLDGELHAIAVTKIREVHELVEIRADMMEAAPRFATDLAERFIQGVGKLNDNFVIMLDIDRIYNSGEMAEQKTRNWPENAFY